jgi:hypothetical protein
MPNSQRVTKVEYQKRVDTLMSLYARGVGTSQLIKAACQQWDVSERQAKRYIQKGKEQQCQMASQPIEMQYSQLLLRFNLIYQQAIQLGDWELARRTATDLAHLLKQQRKELVTHASSQSGTMDPGKLEALIQSLGPEEDA